MDIDTPFGKNSISVDEARRLINASIRLVQTETVSVDKAFNRVAAASVHALISSPPFDVSAMDGYAVRLADVPSAGISLPLAGTSKAGIPTVPRLEPESCIRIFTGAPVPTSADAVIIQEYTEQDGERVRFLTTAGPGENIRKAGINFLPGEEIVRAGHLLHARDVGLLAAAGHTSVTVRKRPRVAVLSTGDELAQKTDGTSNGQILDANRPALMAAIRAWGGVPIDLGIAGDRDDAITQAIKGVDADLLVVSGGASVGDHDRVRPTLQALGLSFNFWKIRMRPGKPLMFGSLGDTPVLGMPGNPVSALVCSLLFLQPAIAALTGGDGGGPEFENARLTVPIGRTEDRDDYLRAIVRLNDGDLTAEAFPQQDSSMLALLAASNSLLFRPAGSPAAQPGEIVKVVRFGMVPGF